MGFVLCGSCGRKRDRKGLKTTEPRTVCPGGGLGLLKLSCEALGKCGAAAVEAIASTAADAACSAS